MKKLLILLLTLYGSVILPAQNTEVIYHKFSLDINLSPLLIYDFSQSYYSDVKNNYNFITGTNLSLYLLNNNHNLGISTGIQIGTKKYSYTLKDILSQPHTITQC